jgi:hypothetical protein
VRCDTALTRDRLIFGMQPERSLVIVAMSLGTAGWPGERRYRIGDRGTESIRVVRPLEPSRDYQVNTASQMRFSVIIPTFKRAQLLGDAIRAALAQTHLEYSPVKGVSGGDED